MDTLHLSPRIRIRTPEFLRWIIIGLSFIFALLTGWVLDLYQLATTNWDLVEHDEDIPPNKLLQLSIAVGVLEVAAVTLCVVYYGWSWPSHSWFIIAIVALGVFLGQALWIRHFKEDKTEPPYGF